MALSALERIRIFALYGIPSGGEAHVAYQLGTLYGPFGEEYDFTTESAALTAALDAADASASILAEVQAAIADWNEIKYSEVEIYKSASGSEGVIVQDGKRRRAIRKYISDLIGFYGPADGFLHGNPLNDDRNRVEK